MYSHQKVPGGSIHSTKTSVKKCVRAGSNFIAFIPSRSNAGEFVWSWILKDCIKVQEKQKRVVVLCSRPPKTCEISQFHVVVAQRRQGVCKKEWWTCRVIVLPIQTVGLFFFCRSRCRRRRRCLSSLVSQGQLEDKANDATFIMRYLFYWTSVFQAQ